MRNPQRFYYVGRPDGTVVKACGESMRRAIRFITEHQQHKYKIIIVDENNMIINSDVFVKEPMSRSKDK